MGRIVWVLAAFMLCLTVVTKPVAAEDLWNRTCVNGVETSLFCNGLCSNPGAMIFNHTKVCATGCNNQTLSCDSPFNVPTELITLSIVAFLVIAGLFVVFATKFTDDWGLMPILFWIMSIFFILMAVGVMGSYFMTGQNALSLVIGSAYLAATFIVFIFIAYIILRFVLRFAIKWLADINKHDKRR